MPEELGKTATDAASHRKRLVVGVSVAVLAALVVVAALQYQKIRRESAQKGTAVGEGSTASELLRRLQKLDEETKDNPRLSREELEARLTALDEETKGNPRPSSAQLEARLTALDGSTKNAP